MKIKFIALTSAIIAIPVFAGLKTETPKQPFSLKIDQETSISSTTGVLIPNTIISLVPSSAIKVYLTDGTLLTGIVKETSMVNNENFKVYGEITNKENTGFGFVLTKEGIFAGAIVFRDRQEVYTVKFSEEADGYILIRSLGKKLNPS